MTCPNREVRRLMTKGRETSELRERAERAERERDRLQCENERLRQQVDHLKRQLDDARRAGFRQAAPFAKPLRPNPKRPGRRAGPAYGPKGHRSVPEQIDERYDAPIPVICPGCGGPVVETALASQYQEELPVVRPVVRQFHVHIGTVRGVGAGCRGATRCRRRMPWALPRRKSARAPRPPPPSCTHNMGCRSAKSPACISNNSD